MQKSTRLAVRSAAELQEVSHSWQESLATVTSRAGRGFQAAYQPSAIAINYMALGHRKLLACDAVTFGVTSAGRSHDYPLHWPLPPPAIASGAPPDCPPVR